MLNCKKYLPIYYDILRKKYVINLQVENVYVHDTPMYLEKSTGNITLFDEKNREMVYLKLQNKYCTIKNGNIVAKL